ncbi:hypothetical protein MESS2_p70009 [Mesorhizobium metallidurans STM 2683]|uniref:Uncharacterized protein n=1 Tax=Mesorhizobium metallidurans STM 2683 TaxID=1297569 RepID=M5F062_9HYPH|nr:hypothetical protein MESS2_p70009 [Mesorhizobium metallidurans STM 2683]
MALFRSAGGIRAIEGRRGRYRCHGFCDGRSGSSSPFRRQMTIQSHRPPAFSRSWSIRSIVIPKAAAIRTDVGYQVQPLRGERIALAGPGRELGGKSLQVVDRDVVRGCELDLLGERDLAEKGADMTGMLLGQIDISKAMRKRRVVQLIAVGRVHRRQD